MDVGALVVREGGRASASGRLVRWETGDWLEPPLPVALVGGLRRRVRAPWHGAIRIAGADFDQLADRFEHDGAIDGFAALTGLWSGGQLLVQHQRMPEDEHPGFPQWVTPPCPAPSAGWPRPQWGRGDRNLHVDLGDLQETGAAVAVTTFRPSSEQAVLVVAAADAVAVEARLRPQLGALLCVVASRWTKGELDTVQEHLHARYDAWNLYLLGRQNNEDGQAHVAAKLTRVLPEIADWTASLPPGILHFDPWLRPDHL